MKKTEVFEGGCLCGNMRFAVNAPVLKPHTCSCSICRCHSGSPTQAWVEFSRDQVQWNGPGGEPSKWRSSDYSCRCFCSVCGSTLGAIDDEPVVAIAVGAFDSPNQEALASRSHTFVSSRPKWWKVESTYDGQ